MSEPKSTLLPTFGRVFGPLVNGSFVAPLTIVLIGFVVFGIWTSRRSAYALALALGVVSIVIYVFSGLSFLFAGSFASVLICTSVIASAALVAGYAFMGWRETAGVAAG
jgi:ABC-type polysaccharide/polyol phosphate export permease